mmetsp:Transcript_87981/g.254036  ORF Transcript_87981/g.254036 Transcript_87981/m.254036 type:complete len:204 (-) Transcript_87981:830-1441(-)
MAELPGGPGRLGRREGGRLAGAGAGRHRQRLQRRREEEARPAPGPLRGHVHGLDVELAGAVAGNGKARPRVPPGLQHGQVPWPRWPGPRHGRLAGALHAARVAAGAEGSHREDDHGQRHQQRLAHRHGGGPQDRRLRRGRGLRRRIPLFARPPRRVRARARDELAAMRAGHRGLRRGTFGRGLHCDRRDAVRRLHLPCLRSDR